MNLQEKKELAKAFSEMQQIDGDEVFKDPKKVLKYLGDLMPKMANKDKHLLGNAIESGTFETISKADPSDMYTYILALAQKMGEDFGSNREDAFDIIDAIALFYGKSGGSLSYREKSTVEYTPSAPQQTNDNGNAGYETKPVTPLADNTARSAPKPVTPSNDNTVKSAPKSQINKYHYQPTSRLVYFIINALLVLACDGLVFLWSRADETEALGSTFIMVCCMVVSVIIQSIILFTKYGDAAHTFVSGGVIGGFALWIVSLAGLTVMAFWTQDCPFYNYIVIDIAIWLFFLAGFTYFGRCFSTEYATAHIFVSILLLIALLIYLLVNNLATTNFVESGIFAIIANIFLFLWGVVRCLIELALLVIGAGFWWKSVYSGLFLEGPMLNMLCYAIFAMFIAATCFLDDESNKT